MSFYSPMRINIWHNHMFGAAAGNDVFDGNCMIMNYISTPRSSESTVFDLSNEELFPGMTKNPLRRRTIDDNGVEYLVGGYDRWATNATCKGIWSDSNYRRSSTYYDRTMSAAKPKTGQHMIEFIDLPAAVTDNIKGFTVTSNLATINLSGTSITDRAISLLRLCPHLEELNISETNIKDVGELAVLSKLKKVNFSCTNITCDSLLSSSNNKLTHINLSRNKTVTDNTLQIIWKNCKQLQELQLQRTAVKHLALTDRDIKIPLTHIDLSMSADLQSGKIQNLPLICPKLKYIDISGTGLNDADVEALIEGCTNLLQLNIKECPSITVDFVDGIIRSDIHVKCGLFYPNIIEDSF